MKKIHIVPHTHWDREWYRPYGYFRTKSIFVIDRVLEALSGNPGFRHFMLDGQTSIVEDYLRMRPSEAPLVEELVSSGKLAVGPWYIQPDEFASDGESLVRNLQIGISQARGWGRCMMVGYLPDSFGHCAQMPRILAGFGIGAAVVMRGVDAESLGSSEFRWTGLSGEAVLAIYLVKGYSNAMFLSEKLEVNRHRMAALASDLGKWTRSDTVLAMNGVDHAFPQEQAAELAASEDGVGIGSLEEYIDGLGAALETLPEAKGELITPVHHRVHTSIASTRMNQKIENRRASGYLERIAEPVCAQAWIEGARYPSELVEDAWKVLLSNQTHDGIGGCCTDEVHREMDQRFLTLRQASETIAKSHGRALACRIDSEGRLLTVYNTGLRAGRSYVRAEVIFDGNFRLLDAEGTEIGYQVLDREEIDVSHLSIWTLYLGESRRAQRNTILFPCDFEGALSRRSLRLEPGEPTVPASWENGFYGLEIHPDGSLEVRDKASGETYRGLNVYEDVGDAGDSYNYSPPKEDKRILSTDFPAEIRCLDEGPLLRRYEIRQVLSLPESLDEEASRRSDETAEVILTTTVELYAGSPLIAITADIDNRALSHRLRALFPLGSDTDHSFAETQFGIIRRPVAPPRSDPDWPEVPLPVYSMQRFCGLESEGRGLAVLNRGLTEYEVYRNEGRATMAVTLHRGVGWMGRENLAVRPGRPSGVLMPTPDAQSVGLLRREYALLVGGAAAPGGLVAEADRYASEPFAAQNRLDWFPEGGKTEEFLDTMSVENLQVHIAGKIRPDLEPDRAYLSLSGERLAVSSVKKALAGDALAVRIYNPGPHPARERLRVGFAHRTVEAVDLMEENPRELAGTEWYDLPELAAGEILTLRIAKENS